MVVEVQCYDFEIEYAPGNTMVVADTLSRDGVSAGRRYTWS